MEMHIEDVPVRSFLQKAIAFNESYGAKYSVDFVLEDVPERVKLRADPDRLTQVMANLLSNAAKFSPRGGKVTVRSSEQNMRMRIEVEDRGPGIPQGFQGRVFEKFAQADSSTSRRFEGTGLGLSITRNLIEAMGGTIGFTTAAGEGTIFYFDLPRAEHAAPSIQGAASEGAMLDQIAPAANNPPLPQKSTLLPRILHVEDNMDLSNVIKTVLAGKVEVVTAHSLYAAEKLLCEQAFSLVLLDMGLPDGHGLSLLEEPVLARQSIPIVILSTTEVSRRVRQRVAATLVKSRVSEAHIVETILSLLPESLN
jgi:CheY-like chemotaxis protein